MNNTYTIFVYYNIEQLCFQCRGNLKSTKFIFQNKVNNQNESFNTKNIYIGKVVIGILLKIPKV